MDKRSVALAPSPASAHAARHFVAGALRSWGREDLAEVAVLLTSEVVTKAILHARTDHLVVIVRLDGSGVRVTVRDEDITVPGRRERDLDDGHGLAVVDDLASSWGTLHYGDGKAVWFEVK